MIKIGSDCLINPQIHLVNTGCCRMTTDNEKKRGNGERGNKLLSTAHSQINNGFTACHARQQRLCKNHSLLLLPEQV